MQVRCLSLLFASQFLRAPFPDNKFVNNIENSTTAAREQPKLPNKRPEQPTDKSKSKRANKLTTLDDKRKIQTSFAAVSIMGNTVFFFVDAFVWGQTKRNYIDATLTLIATYP